ncbi:hypothetical protein FBR05_07370 [Deltaproteobacteria bacterium PRO3]|nr:hypothetical protein [Deltaproteobacteria bacterium PRO3]
MKIKLLGTLALLLTIGMILPALSHASGGITAITGDEVAQSFNTRVEGGSYVVEGQGLKITIENGVVTVTKDKDIVKIGESVEITGPIEARRVEAANGIIDTGVTANTGIAASGGITALPAPQTTTNTVNSTGFTTKFFRKLGIE